MGIARIGWNPPPLILAVEEHFYAQIATFCKMDQNSVKFHIDGFWKLLTTVNT